MIGLAEYQIIFTLLRIFQFLAAVLALSLLPSAQILGQSGSLPELGESSTRFLNSQQEADIGKQFLRQLIAAENYITDPELRNYLNTLGREVGQRADLRGVTLQFNLLEENELNAFAVPGGYITFNSGLLLTTDSESELASVVGHEIAHLSQRHLPRMIAKAEAAKLPTTAAIIASILVGGQAGIAGVTLANANMLSNQLAYSREFEREADAIGMRLMANSGYDPEDMPNFFNKLQRFNVISSKDVPEFLRSHPLSYTRIAESEARLNTFPHNAHQSSVEFYFVRAKIRALYAGSAIDAEKVLDDETRNLEGISRDASQYGLALVQARLRKFSEASKTLSEVENKYGDLPAVQIAMAEMELESGAIPAAVARYEKLLKRHPDKTYLYYYYIDALLEHDDPASAKKVTRYQLRRNPQEYNLLQKLSIANVAMGNLAEAHQADGEYLAALGSYKKAIASMKLALRDNTDNSEYLKKSVSARITALEQLIEDAEKAD